MQREGHSSERSELSAAMGALCCGFRDKASAAKYIFGLRDVPLCNVLHVWDCSSHPPSFHNRLAVNVGFRSATNYTFWFQPSLAVFESMGPKLTGHWGLPPLVFARGIF